MVKIMIMEKIGSLEEEALKRKERLKELKTKQWNTDKKNKDAPSVPRYLILSDYQTNFFVFEINAMKHQLFILKFSLEF